MKGMGKEREKEKANESRAFSNLVADNQYSALGLVLLGCLARVKSALAMLVEEAEIAVSIVGEEPSVEIERADGPSDDFGEVERTEGETKLPAVEETPQLTMSTLAQLESEQPGSPRIDKRPGQDMVVHAPKPRKKRKEGKGDAFDDLFSSLI